jgi:hypothetical protein
MTSQDTYWKETAKQVKRARKAERLKLIEASNFLGLVALSISPHL